MSNFFSSITEKAQSALNSSPIAQHLPAGMKGQTANNSAEGEQGGILKSHAFESIHQQLRTFQQQYSSSVSPVQKIITTEKGVAIDLDSLSRDTHAHSKEMYTWGQNEEADIKDVTDRLAWINFIEGSLAHTLATRINASRAPLKALRDAEITLNGHLNIRTGLQNQIARIEHEQRRGNEQRLVELKKQLEKAEVDDEPLEKEVDLLKRKAVRDSEQMKWQAVREYAEKLILLSQGAYAVLQALPVIPPLGNQPYAGAQWTAGVRATLQHGLDNYKPGDITLSLNSPSTADLSRSDTRGFGETHARELSHINSTEPSTQPGIPLTPPPTATEVGAPPPAPSLNSNLSGQSVKSATGGFPPSPPPKASSPPYASQSPPLNPATLNQAPAPIPIPTNTSTSVVAPNPTDPTVKISSVTPTVAETGVPKSAGSEGPGPASGSLLDLKGPSPRNPLPGSDTKGPYGTDSLAGYGMSTAYESAEDEKKRLQREERERILREGGSASSSSGPAPSGKLESTEEEKRRLEREERDRILAGEPGSQQPPNDSELPPYEE
ncbi:hypothetical protein AcW1_000782 [Taiwanofungus camphoratus]|nr:hypothetical protein AcV5_004683 [Antrodia cinnamomea]KAI0961800.1 hypothetical protein AcV7_000803 [Antrodia cinnamomea]KAI0963809.1 hypothetical protein AcW1_000782 [Antrodia cinnamomea]